MAKFGLTSITPGTDGNVLTSDGTNWVSETPAGGGGITVLDKAYYATPIVSTTAETAYYSYSVPADTIGATGALRISFIGYIYNNDSNSTLTLSFKFGGTTFFTQSASTLPIQDIKKPLYIDIILANNNSTSSQTIMGNIKLSNTVPTTGIGGVNTDEIVINNVIGSDENLSIDTTATQTFEMTAQFGINSANTKLVRYSAITELL